MAKRARLEIIYDILDTIRKNNNFIKFTPLLRKSNISTARFKEYLFELIEKGFVRELDLKNGKAISLTNKGFIFLDKYKTIITFIDEFEL